jgi:AraC-like DNA-binding protein
MVSANAAEIDPLAEVVTLLQPEARFSKLVEAAGAMRIRRSDPGAPFYCAVLEGQCRLIVDDAPPATLQAGDFVLVAALHTLVTESLDPPAETIETRPVQIADGRFRVGRPDGPPELRLCVGHCSFGAPDAALLVSLLPRCVLVRGVPRLATLVQMVGEETRSRRPARDLVLQRLLEVLLIEALRGGTDLDMAAPGESVELAPSLARGLADERLAAALRALHARPAHPWTVAALAGVAALSRSAFFARFSRTIGMAPMEYLLNWRLALAKRLLRKRELRVEQVARQVGYGSASTFSVAFTRHAGISPSGYADAADATAAASAKELFAAAP